VSRHVTSSQLVPHQKTFQAYTLLLLLRTETGAQDRSVIVRVTDICAVALNSGQESTSTHIFGYIPKGVCFTRFKMNPRAPSYIAGALTW
jgi:hypothetical protein